MGGLVKKVLGWASAAIFAAAVIFYVEGFTLYSFYGNLGFAFSLFVCPIGIIAGSIGRKESNRAGALGMYGNLAAVLFGLLYWPAGYLIEILFNRIK